MHAGLLDPSLVSVDSEFQTMPRRTWLKGCRGLSGRVSNDHRLWQAGTVSSRCAEV